MGDIARASAAVVASGVRGHDGDPDHPSQGQVSRVREAWRRFRYPTQLHAWRWRLLGLWVIVFTVLVGLALQRQSSQADTAVDLANKNKATNIRQERTIRTLCDDLYILDGLTETAINSARLRKADHQRRGLEAQVVADTNTIRNFELYSAQILDQLTQKDSPCVVP